jgi:hypothetical protein
MRRIIFGGKSTLVKGIFELKNFYLLSIIFYLFSFILLDSKFLSKRFSTLVLDHYKEHFFTHGIYIEAKTCQV